MNENDLLRTFIERVPFDIPHVRVFRRNIIDVPSTIAGRTFRVRNGIAGQGDAYAIVRGGYHIEIETKAARGSLRDSQTDWASWCDVWGVRHLVLRARKGEQPLETVTRWIEELREVTR